MNSGNTAIDLANCLISVIAKHINIKEYFSLGVIHHVNKSEKEIHTELKNIVIATTGDGLLWMERHRVYFALILLRSKWQSKTMSVPKFIKTYCCLHRVIKYFDMSTISKEKLNEALAILDMNQLKLLSWGGTRMSHFVTACK